MAGIRYLSGRSQFIGIGIAYPTNYPGWKIPLDPAQYAGAIVWTQEGTHYWSNGEFWVPLLELPIDTPYVLAPTNEFEKRQLRLTAFSSNKDLEHGQTEFEVYDNAALEGEPVQITLTWDTSWLVDEELSRTYTLDVGLSPANRISEELQKFGFTYGDTIYIRGKYLSTTKVSSRWSAVSSQQLPDRIARPRLLSPSGATTDVVRTSPAETGYPKYHEFQGAVIEVYDNPNEVGIEGIEPLYREIIFRNDDKFTQAQAGNIVLNTSLLEDGTEYYYRVRHLASSIFENSTFSEYNNLWPSEWSLTRSFYPVATSIVLKIDTNYGEGPQYEIELLGEEDLSGSINWGGGTATVPINGPKKYKSNYGTGVGDYGEKTVVIKLDPESKGKLHAFNSWEYTNTSEYKENYAPKLIEVLALGEDMGLGTLDFSFRYCTNLTKLPDALPKTAIGEDEFKYITDLQGTFEGCTSLTSPRIENWDVSKVTDFGSTFSGCVNLNVDLSRWDVSSGTKFGSMFEGCQTFNTNINGWEFGSGVDSITSMFEGARSFNQPVNNWGQYLTNVGSYIDVFKNALSFDQDLDLWFTPQHKVIDISGMLQCTYGVQDGNNRASYRRGTVANWDVSRIQNTFSAFYNQQFLDFDASNWNLESLQYGRFMFMHCRSFTGSPEGEDGIANWKLPSLIDGTYMFRGTSIDNDVGGWFKDDLGDPAISLIDTYGMFYDCTEFQGMGLSEWDTAIIQDMGYMFYGCESLTADLSNWDVSGVGTNFSGNMDYMFAKTLINFDFTNWDFSNTKSIRGMFVDCTALGSDGVDNNLRKLLDPNATGHVDFTVVRDLWRLFDGALYFNEDLGEWDTSNVYRIAYMFRNAAFFNNGGDIGKQLNDMDWDVSNVTQFQGTFYNATSFNQSLANWNVSKGNNFSSMFVMFRAPTVATTGKWFGYKNDNDDAPLGQDLSNWRLDNATTLNAMFWTASKVNFDADQWFVNKVENFGVYPDITGMHAMFRGASSFNSGLGSGVVGNKMASWPVSKVPAFRRVFENADAFNQNISTWDVSGCKDFSYMFSSANNFNFGFDAGEGSPTPDLLDGWIMDGRNHADPTKAVDISYMFNGCHAFNQNLNNVSVYWDKNSNTGYAGVENMDNFLAFAYRWNNGFASRVTPAGDDGIIAWQLTALKRMSQAFRDNDNQDRAALALVFNITAPLLEDVGGMLRGHQWYSEQSALMDNLKFWFQKYPKTYSMNNFLYGDRDSTTGKIPSYLLTEIYSQWYQDVTQNDGITKKPGIAARIKIHMGASKYFLSVQPLKDTLTLPASEGGQFEWYMTDGGPTE